MAKRIGLARTEALIENLKRDIQFNQSTLSGQKKPVIELNNSSAVSRQLTQDESNSLIVITPSTDAANTITITLPDRAAGLTYDFIFTSDATNAGADVKFTTGNSANHFIGAIVCNDGAADILSVQVGCSSITADMGSVTALLGVRGSIVCGDSNHWYITIFHARDGKDCVASAAGSGVQFVCSASA